MKFHPVANAPGFSHRVEINGRLVDWLANDFKPNRKTTAFFVNKHRA